MVTAEVVGDDAARRPEEPRRRARRAEPTILLASTLVPWIFTTAWEDGFYLPKLIALWVVLAATAWFLALDGWPSTGLRHRFVAAVDVPLALFLALTTLATVASTDPHQSVFGERLQHQGLLTLSLYVGYFAVARTAVRLRPLLVCVAAGAALVAAYAVLQQLGIDPWWDELPHGRSFATIGQPNALAAYLVLAVPGTVAITASSTGRLRTLGGVAVVVMVVAVATTMSRGGLVALVVLAPFLAATRVRARSLVVGAIASLAVVVPTVGDDLRDRVASAVERGGDLSVRDHVDGWRVAVEIIGDQPLLGTGPETFPDQFPAYSPTALSPERAEALDALRVESPHNGVLHIAAGAGVPAAAAFVAFVVGVGWRIARAGRSMRGPARVELLAVLAALVGFVVTNSFMTTEVTGGWLAWTLAGAGLRASTTAAVGRG